MDKKYSKLKYVIEIDVIKKCKKRTDLSKNIYITC